MQRQRLRFDALRWTASKLRPRAWGDSVAVAVEVEHRISITAALQAAEQQLLTVDADPCARIGADYVAPASPLLINSESS